MGNTRWALVIGSLVCGCARPEGDIVTVEPNELGITRLEVKHEYDHSERLLRIRGLDDVGEEIATVTLRTGMVRYGADMPEQVHEGTELITRVHATRASFVSPDRVAHVIAEPLSQDMATLLRLRAVAREIEIEAGIRFAQPAGEDDEVAYAAGTCSGSRFPNNKGGSTSCCQDTTNTWHANPNGTVANRFTYAPSYPSIPVCRKSDGTTGCTSNCLYGPCGAAIGWVRDTDPTTTGHVFVPTSAPTTCGYDTGGTGGLGIDFSPEHYSSQTLYGGTTPTCGCFACNTDGTAVCATYTYAKASNTDASDKFGAAISVSSDGNTIAVGASGDRDAGVYVFVYSGGTWSQQAHLLNAPYPNGGGEFGGSVSLSDDGNTLAVGAPFENSNATGINGDENNTLASNAGAAYVFTRSGTVWTKQAYVKASNTNSWDLFGAGVALSSNGNTLAVGAYGEDSNATGINGIQSDNSAAEAGAVYVFTRSGTTWSQQAYIKASNTEAGDRFGGRASGSSDSSGPAVAVSDDGNTLLVGAPLEDSNATGIGGNQADNSNSGAGAAYVFTRSGTTWSQQAYVKASYSFGNFYFGDAVAVSGDGNTVAVAERKDVSQSTGINNSDQDWGPGGNYGAAFVFTRSGTVWSQQAYIKASNTGDDDYFGYSLSLSTNGNLLAVGAFWEDSNALNVNGDQISDSATHAGAVYRFTRSGSVWAQDRYIKASNSEAEDRFGAAVGIAGDGNTLAIGAVYEDSNATGIGGSQSNNSSADSGAAYIIR